MVYQPRININEYIRAREVRVIDVDGENLGVMKTEDALKKARESDVDLIEVSPNAKPPIAKIMDYGKFQYEQKKKIKKTKTTETKIIQIKVGTSENDLSLKARNISKWIKEGNRVRLDLFLAGRTKYMEMGFLKERIERVLRLITIDYKIADGPKKSPKGLSMVIEKK